MEGKQIISVFVVGVLILLTLVMFKCYEDRLTTIKSENSALKEKLESVVIENITLKNR